MCGILVPGESDEAHFALLLRLAQRFGGAVRADEQFGIVIEADAVNLPQVEMIGLQAAAAIVRSICIARSASRPWVQTLVIRKTLSRRPFRPLPIQSSVLPR